MVKSVKKILLVVAFLLILILMSSSLSTNAAFGGECITKGGYRAFDCDSDKCLGGVMNWQKNVCENSNWLEQNLVAVGIISFLFATGLILLVVNWRAKKQKTPHPTKLNT